MFEQAVRKFELDRTKIINWILQMQLYAKISDEAFFRAVGQADTLLRILSGQNRCDVPKTLAFPLSQPQYFYPMCLL
jgi:hypothetical protein